MVWRRHSLTRGCRTGSGGGAAPQVGCPLPSAPRAPMAGEHLPGGVGVSRRGQSWLCPSDMDRARLVDMNLRAGKARQVQGLVLGVVALAATP